VPQILEFLKKNEKVVHLDLSTNYFTLEECKQIADGINLNRTIYGFHFFGNFGYVDNRGFLVLNSEEIANPDL